MRLRPSFLLAASAAITIAAGGCVSPGTIAPPVTPAMAVAAHGASVETLNEGRRIFVGPCASCHAPDPLEKRSLGEWRAAVDEMAPRAKLDVNRRTALLAYITAARAVSQPPPR